MVKYKKNKKKAFTLAELLVVVLLIGILSAVSVPKMKQVLETRKTTEAENMLISLRTEQEKRCVSGQNYQTDISEIHLLAEATKSPNYTYALQARGASATSSKGYTIQMKSYKTGQLCCAGSYCEKLNKSYPSCDSISYPEDECSAPLTPCETDPNTCACETYAAAHYEQCSPESCTNNHEQEKCCSASEIWSGTACVPACNVSNSEDMHCEMPQGYYTVEGTWSDLTCSCNCPAGSSLNEDGECFEGRCSYLTSDERRELDNNCGQPQNPDAVIGSFDRSTCMCTCPEGSSLDREGYCIPEGGGSGGGGRYRWESDGGSYCVGCLCQSFSERCSSASDVGNQKRVCYDDSDTGIGQTIWSWQDYVCAEY